MTRAHRRILLSPRRTWAAFRRALRTLAHEHTSPRKLALAAYVGIFVGVLPIFGFHLLLCLVLAWALRLNKLALYGAANISNPLFAPFLLAVELQIGHLLTHGQWLGHSDMVALREGGWRFALTQATGDLLLGSIVLGVVLGAIVSLTLWIWLWRRQTGQDMDLPQLDEQTLAAGRSEVLRRLTSAPRRDRYYARAKLAMDPLPYTMLALVPPAASVLDLGCGFGLLAMLRASRHDSGTTLGVDWDSNKIQLAQRVLEDYEAASFITKELPNSALPKAQVVILADILHYMSQGDRDTTLEQALDAVEPGGQLFLRDMAERHATQVHRWTEWFGILSHQNRGTRVQPLDFDAVAQRCRDRGFEVEFRPFAALPFFADCLLRARAPAASTLAPQSPSE